MPLSLKLTLFAVSDNSLQIFRDISKNWMAFYSTFSAIRLYHVSQLLTC